MPNLMILVGIPGCGKSHFAQQLSPGYVVISTDIIRERLCGDINDQSKNDEVFPTFYASITDALRDGENVVADSTGLTQDVRSTLSKIAHTTQARTVLVLFKNLHEARWRNRTRDRTVPEDVMERMERKYNQTLTDLAQEHYDCIMRISGYGGVTITEDDV